MKEKVTKDKLRTKTEKILDKVNHLARESHVRHITIKDHKHRHLVTFPLSFGIAAAVALPIVAGLGLAAFLINDWRVAVEKHQSE